MKKYYLLITFTIYGYILCSQVTQRIYDIVTKNQMKLNDNINHEKGRYVSSLTFRHMISHDFASLTQADKMNSTVGSYASLDINSTERTFQFSPYVYSSDVKFKPYKHLFSIDLAGSLNGKGFFSKENKYSVKAGLSWVYILKEGYTSKKSAFDEDKTKCMYDEIAKKVISKINTKGCFNDSIDAEEVDEMYLDAIVEEELMRAKSMWSSKQITWLKISAQPLSYDVIDYYSDFDSSSILSPATMNVFNPSLSLSLNHVYKSRKFTIYLSGWGKWSVKNTFSEIHTTEQWRKINKVNDSIYFENESLDVYKLPSSGFSKLGIFDAGVQFISMWHSDKINIGLDLKFTNLGFITPNTKNDISRINQILIGIIFPFNDKEGNPTINIEPFYQYSEYNDFEVGSKSTAGVRFGLPISNLF